VEGAAGQAELAAVLDDLTEDELAGRLAEKLATLRKDHAGN